MKNSIAAVPLVLFLAAGCAKDNLGTLNLDSVMSLKSKQEAMAQIESNSPHVYSPQALDGMREALETSGLKTPEIILLTLPSTFVEYSGAGLEKYKAQKKEPLPPFTEILWEHRETGVRVMAGRADLKASEVTAQTREAFVAKLGDVIKSYDETYRKEHSSQASGKVEELGKLIKLTVIGKFLKEGTWHTDRRLFYLFKPEYRLSILITGEDEALALTEGELTEGIELLEKRLPQLYPEGIPFAEAS